MNVVLPKYKIICIFQSFLHIFFIFVSFLNAVINVQWHAKGGGEGGDRRVNNPGIHFRGGPNKE